MSRAECIEAATHWFDSGEFFRILRSRVALRTESDTGQPNPLLKTYLTDEMTAALEDLGFACELVENSVVGAGPFLIARRIEDASLPTVLGYGHGDVVSGQEGRWREGLSPWQLTVEGDRWYGRGTADNKGQHTINLGALASVIATRKGRLGYNVTMLLETGEEAASPGLHAICKNHAVHLKADLFLASDGPRVHAGQPTLFLGSRGAVNFTLGLHCRDKAFHSGNWGGALRNPATVLASAVASLVDGQGRILVEALKPQGVPPSVKRALAEVNIGGDAHDPVPDEGWGEPGLNTAEKLMAWNTIEVLALGAGNPQRPVNAIPGEAVAHCQLRFVVGTPWEELAPILRAHLDSQGFGEVSVDITLSGAATRLDPDNPWVGWAQRSIEASSGKRPTTLPNLAGSLPNDVFADLLGLPTLWVPHSYPACAQHAPNEHLLASVAREGLQIMAGLYWDLGETNTFSNNRSNA